MAASRLPAFKKRNFDFFAAGSAAIEVIIGSNDGPDK
jgi:hypothetical protein